MTRIESKLYSPVWGLGVRLHLCPSTRPLPPSPLTFSPDSILHHLFKVLTWVVRKGSEAGESYRYVFKVHRWSVGWGVAKMQVINEQKWHKRETLTRKWGRFTQRYNRFGVAGGEKDMQVQHIKAGKQTRNEPERKTEAEWHTHTHTQIGNTGDNYR